MPDSPDPAPRPHAHGPGALGRFIVRGRVQGVGYRAFVARQAPRHRLTGWVRNRADGSVEMLLAGAPDDIAAMLDACRRGPPGARVDAIEPIDVASSPEPGTGFAVLPTL